MRSEKNGHKSEQQKNILDSNPQGARRRGDRRIEQENSQ